MVANAPDCSRRFLCSYQVNMSPLPTTGIEDFSRISPMRFQFAARV